METGSNVPTENRLRPVKHTPDLCGFAGLWDEVQPTYFRHCATSVGKRRLANEMEGKARCCAMPVRGWNLGRLGSLAVGVVASLGVFISSGAMPQSPKEGPSPSTSSVSFPAWAYPW